MTLDYKLMGQRIKKARKKKGYTQEDLAEFMSVSTTHISRIENGRTRLNLPRLVELCNLLEVSADYLIDGISKQSVSYLNREIDSALKDVSSDEKELVYEVMNTVIETRKKQTSK